VAHELCPERQVPALRLVRLGSRHLGIDFHKVKIKKSPFFQQHSLCECDFYFFCLSLFL
jgi:hypothetical protein